MAEAEHAMASAEHSMMAAEAKAVSDVTGKSVNQFVVEAVGDAVRRRRAERALGNMAARRTRMAARGRVGPASESLIHQLREGEGRRG